MTKASPARRQARLATAKPTPPATRYLGTVIQSTRRSYIDETLGRLQAGGDLETLQITVNFARPGTAPDGGSAGIEKITILVRHRNKGTPS